jgi:hypothetical protein
MDELNHSAGKGDKERSPGWRRNYDEIDFHRSTRDGFARRGNRLVKAYGGVVARFNFPEPTQPTQDTPAVQLSRYMLDNNIKL